MSLMFSISGLRGIVGEDLTTAIVSQYARMFGTFVGPGTIVIGRDTRKSGPVFRGAVISGLNAVGCTVIDLGIVPTPTVLFMVKKLKAQGGIAITASHNPIQWNALKFITRRGQFLDEKEFKRLSKVVLKKDSVEKKTEKNTVLKRGEERHIEAIASFFETGSRNLRVGIDAVNGAGSIALPKLLGTMGCTVYRLHCTFRPTFSRKPEPIPENIRALCQFVKKKKLDIGFAVDPDCDRLSIVDERGHAIGEEKTVVLATDYVLSKTRGTVVTNLSTTALMDYIVQKFHCPLYRTKVGEANVVSKMKHVHAIIGGEGNGGVIYPKVNYTRDALVSAAIVVNLITERGKTISEMCAQYPTYYMVKKKLRIPKERLLDRREKIISAFKGKIDALDGLKITANDYWLHIRPSQTEPFVRIIGEAQDKKKINQHIRHIASILK
jgi:phosphomannomutase